MPRKYSRAWWQVRPRATPHTTHRLAPPSITAHPAAALPLSRYTRRRCCCAAPRASTSWALAAPSPLDVMTRGRADASARPAAARQRPAHRLVAVIAHCSTRVAALMHPRTAAQLLAVPLRQLGARPEHSATCWLARGRCTPRATVVPAPRRQRPPPLLNDHPAAPPLSRSRDTSRHRCAAPRASWAQAHFSLTACC